MAIPPLPAVRALAVRRLWPLGLGLSAAAALFALSVGPTAHPPTVGAQACPPYCGTPVITPAWHLHMCDETYQAQLDDNHCMFGPGVTEFPAGTDTVHIIYCHSFENLVKVFVKDSGGGRQFVNHPDGIFYGGQGCETITFEKKNGIPPGGSPYYTSAVWPEGPFSGIGAGIEWFVGLYVAFDADVYYGAQAQAAITARDPAANLDPSQRDRITVRVTSDADPTGILVTLVEEAAGFPLFHAEQPVRFSTEASNAAQGIIKVVDRSTITVHYCPRDCKTEYTDDAEWLSGDATVTPTSLPTYAGPPPTVTPTPPPAQEVDVVTIRPAPADVGYVPRTSAVRGRKNHLGYESIYAGMWGRGDNPHYGMIQFDLSEIPTEARVIDARLELVGQTNEFLKAGAWKVELLTDAVDAGWRDATFDIVSGAAVAAQIGPAVSEIDLLPGRVNAFGFAPAQLPLLEARARTTGKASFRVDGPLPDENNLAAWQSGVDVYNHQPVPPDPALGPSLFVRYAIGLLASPTPVATLTVLPPSATVPGGGPATATATATATPPAPTISATPSTSPTPSATVPPTAQTATAIAGATATVAAIRTEAAATVIAGPTVTAAAATETALWIATQTAAPGVTASAAPAATGTAGAMTEQAATSGAPPSATRTMTPPPTAPTPTDAPSTTPGTPPAAQTPTPSGPPTPTRDPSTFTGRQACVIAFEDRNGDGARDPSERFLAGVTVRLTHRLSGVFITWTTDGTNDPDHCWSGLADGAYRLELVELPRNLVHSGPSGYDFAAPMAEDSVTYAFGAAAPTTPTVTPPAPRPTVSPTPAPTRSPTRAPTLSPTPEPTVVGPKGSVCVDVFDDRNHDGFRDTGETRIADVLIDILTDRHGALRQLRSRSEDAVCATLPAGVYFVSVAPPSGWTATGLAEQGAFVTDGTTTTLPFGLAPQRGPLLFLPFARRAPLPSRSASTRGR
ncbi:MAG: hypothetical protein ABI780_00970 [Ardenticatenales bacterium]